MVALFLAGSTAPIVVIPLIVITPLAFLSAFLFRLFFLLPLSLQLLFLLRRSTMLLFLAGPVPLPVTASSALFRHVL